MAFSISHAGKIVYQHEKLTLTLTTQVTWKLTQNGK